MQYEYRFGAGDSSGSPWIGTRPRGRVLDKNRCLGCVEVSDEMPQGVRYSLTLHGPYGKRILGYDNAHAVKPPKKFKYAGRILAYDHKHRHASDQGVPYEFKDVHQLMCDFFADVDRILSEVKGP